eukprot:17706_1
MTSNKDYQKVPSPEVTGGDAAEVHIGMTNQIQLQEYDKKEESKHNEQNKDKNKTLKEYKMGPLYDEHQWVDIRNLRLDGLPSNWSWEQVQKWLYETNLWIMWDILDGIEGYGIHG